MGPDSDWREVESGADFGATVARLVDAIEKHGMTVFARIDHATAAAGIGFAMPPTLVLLYGNPSGGTPIMLAAPRAALDLPLRVLVREDAGRVLVAFHPVAAMLARAGVSDVLATRLDPAQQVLVDALKDRNPRPPPGPP
jgi:uncharacterized protein (DUF302 family)